MQIFSCTAHNIRYCGAVEVQIKHFTIILQFFYVQTIRGRFHGSSLQGIFCYDPYSADKFKRLEHKWNQDIFNAVDKDN